MRKAFVSVIPLVFALLCCAVSSSIGKQFGLFTYHILDDDTIQITDYPDDATGHVDVPEEISGKKVTTIGNAFYGCHKLTSVHIPASVSSIGRFRACSKLTAIHVEPGNESYASIDGVVFNAAKTHLLRFPQGREGGYTVPESVIWVGEESSRAGGEGPAFYFCSFLTSITITQNVTGMARGEFSGSPLLESIYVAPENKAYASIDAVLYSAGKERLIRCPEGKVGAFVVPPGVTHIAGAYRKSGSLFTVSGAGAFCNCSNLTHITLPSTVTEIGPAAFFNCSGLTNLAIPEGVERISEYTFHGCSSLTSVSIPSTVTSIDLSEGVVFYGCGSLISINVDPRNSHYCSNEGGLFDAAKTTLIKYPGGRDGAYTIPSHCSTIGNSAFSYCSGLTSVTLPKSITTIDSSAFRQCSRLAAVTFLGDRPKLGFNVLVETAPGFTIYYLSSKHGFTSPRWEGYPTVMIDETAHPAAHWLLRHQLPYDTELHQDTNGDGVNLLTAYALNLDPGQRLHGSLPLPILGPEGLMMTFHAASPGIGYFVQTSDDLRRWTSEGVTLSELNGEGIRTASVGRDSQKRFMRLMVSN